MTQKVGRNDPCPCGSGKKYKSCHMLQEKETAAAKYTPTGKRKFKAKVIQSGDMNVSLFGRSAIQSVTESERQDQLRFNKTGTDFRVKTETESKIVFPKDEEIQPEEKERHLPKAEEEFTPTAQDFRKKRD